MQTFSVSTRRQMLAATAFTAFAATVVRPSNATNQPQAEDDSDAHPWIDAHSHIWTTDLTKYPLRDNQTVEALQPRSFYR